MNSPNPRYLTTYMLGREKLGVETFFGVPPDAATEKAETRLGNQSSIKTINSSIPTRSITLKMKTMSRMSCGDCDTKCAYRECRSDEIADFKRLGSRMNERLKDCGRILLHALYVFLPSSSNMVESFLTLLVVLRISTQCLTHIKGSILRRATCEYHKSTMLDHGIEMPHGKSRKRILAFF